MAAPVYDKQPEGVLAYDAYDLILYELLGYAASRLYIPSFSINPVPHTEGSILRQPSLRCKDEQTGAQNALSWRMTEPVRGRLAHDNVPSTACLAACGLRTLKASLMRAAPRQ